MTLEPGTKLDRYTIEALLGEGAMGKVYRAFDARLERAVAIKVLEPVLPGADGSTPTFDGGLPSPTGAPPLHAFGAEGAGEAVASALREARAAAAILHPNATSIFDADRIGDTSFIVMELVPGTSLRRFVGDAALPVTTRIRWLVDVAGALAAAHRAGVIHRDVKPENILVRDDGLVKVLDFGIARLPRSGLGSFATLTTGSGLLGTPAYMAPEQIRGEEIDGRADQFGWGVLAYELLAGRLPWGSPEPPADPIALLAAVLSDQPTPFPSESGVPPDVAACVLRALSKAAADRFPSMNDAAAVMTPHAGARRPLRRAAPAPEGAPALSLRESSEDAPSTPIPSGHAAVELGFSEQVAPSASSIIPDSMDVQAIDPGERASPDRSGESGGAPPTVTDPGEGASADPVDGGQPDGRPRAPVDAVSRTLTSGLVPDFTSRLRPPDFSAPVDVDAHLARLRPDATCKGIFFIELLRIGATAMSPSELFHLAGFSERRYMGFRDYPAAEYLRLCITVALAVHTTLPLGEALRRIGHSAFHTASSSLVGKTLFGVYGRDLEPLLFAAPRAYRVFLNFGEVTVEKAAPGVFRFTTRDLPAFLETYQVGVLEGVLRHCGAEGRIRVLIEALDRATLELSLL